jgi:hypothetical protein
MSSFRGRMVTALLVGLAAATWGCSSKTPDRVPAPDIDPAGSAAQAMLMYDTNKDGAIAGDELNKCPALKASIKRYSNGDGRVTADIIAARLQKIKDSKVGINAMNANVTLDDKNLEGATVLLEPEPFMGNSISPASGVTNAKGSASLAIDPEDRFKKGVNPGLYKVRITKQVNGKESIPARYNKDTELGVEVAQDNLELGKEMRFQLKSR